MDQLPIELIHVVFEHLQCLNLAPTPYSEFTEDPPDEVVLARRDLYKHRAQNIRWLKLTESSRADILNARLTSRLFYNTSHKSLARVLADRAFRLTNVGFQDLVGITQNKKLLHHIRHLTLGCAIFKVRLCINESDFLVKLEPHDQSRLVAAYIACRDWYTNNKDAHADNLAAILKAFPNLGGIRVRTDDDVSHLGGWLKPGDEDILHANGYQFRYPGRLNRPSRPTMLYNKDSREAKKCILNAIQKSGLTLQDFRADPAIVVDNMAQLPAFTSALHTLRVDLFEEFMGPPDLVDWASLFDQTPNLRDLSFGIQGRWQIATRILTPVRLKGSGDNFFRALRDHGHLQRVELEGGWTCSESFLIDFVAGHMETLRCLILSHVSLHGSWQRALDAIAHTTYDRKMFLKVKAPRETPNLGEMAVKPDQSVEQALLRFSYPVVWVV